MGGIKVRHFPLSIVLTALACCHLQAAQQVGQVRAADQPIPGASVTATQGTTKQVAFTDEEGRYTLNLAPGVWVIQVEMLGFTTAREQIAIADQSGTGLVAIRNFSIEMSGAQATATQAASKLEGFQSVQAIAIQDGRVALAAATPGAGDPLQAGGSDVYQAFLVIGSTSGGLGAASDHFQSQAEPRPQFDAASIKPLPNATGRSGGAVGCGPMKLTPGRIAGAPTVQEMILEAYQLTPHQLSGGPTWVGSDRFCVDARAAAPAEKDQLRLMLQNLLAERFKLVVERSAKEMSVYALTVAKNGPTLHELKPGEPMPTDAKTLAALVESRPIQGTLAGAMNARWSMQEFAEMMSRHPLIDRPVLDKTGLKAQYLFFLRWGSEDNFMTAMEEQFGLTFESQRARMDTLIINHIEKPSEN